MNRGEIKTMIKSYVHRQHTDSDLNNWINWTNKRIGRDLRSHSNCTRYTLTVTERISGLPADFVEMEMLLRTGENGGSIKLQAGAGFTRALGNEGSAGFYNLISGNEIEIYPFVAGDYTMVYYYTPADMDADEDTNDTATMWPMLYVYGVMIESAATEQDGDLFAAASDIFDREVARINRANLQSLEGMQIEAG